MPKTALIAVDVQYDFLPGGALAVPDGDQVIGPLATVANNVDLVIASRDWHPGDHVSFARSPGDEKFPPHCIQDTRGARIHPTIRKYSDLVVSKGLDREREAFSAFAGGTLRPARKLETILKKEGIQRVLVGGLALEFCVRWTALDANALGFETIVPLDCTAALSARGRLHTLDAFGRAGVQTIDHWSP